jgi:GNAT superfamily N-acetyltransferase
MRIEPIVDEDGVRASVDVLAETDPRRDADATEELHALGEPGRLALLARDDDGAAVGCGATGPIGGDTAWYASVDVRAEARRRGLGSALLARLAEHAFAGGADGLEIETRSDAGLAFAARHRFVETGRESEVVLDLRTASGDGGEPPAGVEIVRRSERPGLEEAMYAVALEAEPDIPGHDGRGPGTFDEFRAVNLDRPARRPELTFVALAGDRVIGYAILHAGSRHIAYHGMTGVARDWRGRGVASALKRRQITAAREAGYDLLVTENEVRNDPIRRLNEAFGYRPYGETVFLLRAGTAPVEHRGERE